MKMPFFPLTRLVLGTLAGIGVVSLLLPQPSWAQQANDVNPLQDFDPEQNSDPFSRTNEGDSFGVFDLIHRANLNNNRSPGDYSAEQNEGLDAAADQFRQMQQQRIQGQQQASPANSVTAPEPGN